MTTQLQLNVFGPPALIRGGSPSRSPVRFRTKKHLAVLLYLHFEGRARSIPRDRLVDLLWPDVPPAKGRHSLSQALLAIRAHLGSDAVTGREQDVQLLAELPSDLSALRHANVATLRVAEPLQGLEDCGGADFAHWVDGARVRLKAQARDALRAGLRAARVRGNTAEAHQLAAALYDVDPLCAEAVYALAERALLDGDTVAAVRLLKAQVQRARAELGSNPNPEIVWLLRRLERGERPAVAPQSAVAGLARVHPFVAREGELGRMEAIANRAVDGSSYQSCLISGTPGVGKSALIRRFATSLQARAWPVFMVSCQEIGQGIPYAAVSDLITALARDPAAGGTEPLWLAEASRVAPALRAIYPGVPDAPDAPTDSIRLRVAEAVRRMIDAVADDGPVLLVFDDLQFLDPASQEVLFLLTRALARAPAVVLAGARPGEGGRDGLPWSETIDLPLLDRSQALALIRDLSGESEHTSTEIFETIVRLAEGNPYHIELLLTDWRIHQADSLVAAESSGNTTAISWTPPEDLRAAFERQYRGLSSDVQHALQVLAVAGKAMAPRDVSSLLGLKGETGVGERVVLEMLDRGVGRIEEGRLSFKNELHRAYVYHAMGNDRRMYHHGQLAQRLAESVDRHELQTMLELVHHSIGAGLERQAIDIALEAAEVVIAHGAPREAERVLARLLRVYDVPAGSRLRLLLAHALVATAQYQRALDALADWRADAPSSVDRSLAALLRADALHRARLGGDEMIIAATREAVALAEQANATAFLVRANYIRMEIGTDGADLAARTDAEALAARIAASDASPEYVALANLTLGQSLLSRGELRAAVERLTAAVPILESLALLVELRRAQSVLGICYRGLGKVEEATGVLREAVALAERAGHTGGIIHSRILLANLYHDLAWFDAAAECYREVLPPLKTLSSPRALVEAYCDLGRLALVLGSMREAAMAVAQCEEGARRSGLWRHRVTACMARAELHLYQDQPELAWPLLEEATRVTEDRAHLLPDRGRYERLQHQRLWATRREREVSPALPHSLIDGFEVRLFDEAVAETPVTAVLDDAVGMGLLGPLARLVAAGVHHPALPQRVKGESAAQLIARAYPHAHRTAVPVAIGL